jgi:hypothetical protein
MTELDAIRALAAAIPAADPRDTIKHLMETHAHTHWAITEAIAQIPPERRDWEDIARLTDTLDARDAKAFYDPDPPTWRAP